MPRRLAPFLLGLGLVLSAAVAQPAFPVGVRDLVLPNTTGQGTSSLAVRVLYPATAVGTNTPLLARAGGWPTIVFLHGFALLGNSYGPLGTRWAERGFIVVLANTAQFDNLGQEADGRALFPALQAANSAPGGPFAGGIDLARVALSGHSMGGGNVANVLASNPGYRCGFAFAPVPARGSNGALVTVPIGVVAGTGDTITPPATNAQPYYASLTAFAELKLLYLLNGDATHTNLAGLFLSGATATAVFQRAADVGLGFLRHALDLDPTGLEAALGPAALAEPRLVACDRAFARAQAWAAAPLAIGATVRASAGLEPGPAGLGAALAPLVAPVPTPFGALRLDPSLAFVLQAGLVGSERRLDVAIALPVDPTLVGATVALQAFGPTRTEPVWLGGAIELRIEP
jgi:dienelactone hydrolase